MAKLLQKEGNSLDNEQAKRRKRINLYKRIIVIFVIAMILLPTILCIILFIMLRSTNKELEAVKKLKLEQLYYAENSTEDTLNDKGPEPNFYPQNSHMSVNPTESETEMTVTEEPTTEIQIEEPNESEYGIPINDGIPGAVEYSDEIKQALAEGRKVVYLTYDDGPSPNTYQLLDVLDKYNVKVTFFINGYPGYEDELIEIHKRGHTVAMHTYTHRYDVVYGGVDSFANEIALLSDYIYNVIGIRTGIFRFPGGSSTRMTDEIQMYVDYLNQEGMVFFDWNVASGDAVVNPLTTEQVYNNVMSGIAQKDVSIVLMHDAAGKETTMYATELIIQSLQEMNALILPITNDTVPVHHNYQ